MKLFVWEGFCPDWSGGLAFALANTEKEARKMLIKEHGCEPYEWGTLTVRRSDWRFASCVSGGG